MSNDDRAWRRYVADFRRNGLQKIMGSGVCIAIYSADGTDFDVKQATEIGAMLLLDKPLILIVTPGASLPTRLAKAADLVFEDFGFDDDASAGRFKQAIAALSDQGGDHQ